MPRKQAPQRSPLPAEVDKAEFAKWRRPSDSLTYHRWKAACNKRSEKLLGFVAFEDDDPYDLVEMSREPFLAGVKPKDFIEEAFAEDLARQEHDHQEQLEALEHEFAEEMADEKEDAR